MHRVALGVVVVVLLVSASPASADVSGAVGGVRDPAADTLGLWVQASENSGAGLRTARAYLAGQPLAMEHFGDPACAVDSPVQCEAVGGVNLDVPTTAVTDGERRLEVTIEDGAGVVTHVVDRTITVANTPIPWTDTVTIGIGSGTTQPSPGGGDPGPGGGGGPGSGGGGDATGCQSPRLSVALAQKPLKFRRSGTPVLVARRKYRFRGKLTCVIDGRRRAAPRGTKIELRHVVRRRVISKKKVRVRSKGRILERLAFRSSRTLVFRLRGADRKLLQVRIPIKVMSRRQARR